MLINKNGILRIAVFFTILMLSPLLLAQEDDISVKFSFKKPNEFICEIQNKTDYRMIIRFNNMESLSLSEARFDIIKYNKDTIRNMFYQIKKKPPYYIHINPGQIYRTLFRDSDTWRFIKSRIYITYTVETSIPKNASFEKTFDLNEVRKESVKCLQDSNMHLHYPEAIHGEKNDSVYGIYGYTYPYSTPELCKNQHIVLEKAEQGNIVGWIKRLKIMDSTTISLFPNLVFKGVGRCPRKEKKKSGLKVHTIISANEAVSCDVQFPSVATHDYFLLCPAKLKKR